MNENGDENGDEVVCEFFGIKITTRNPGIARVLTSDIGKVMNLDVTQVKTFLTGEDTDDPDGEQGNAKTPAGDEGELRVTKAQGVISEETLRKLLDQEE